MAKTQPNKIRVAVIGAGNMGRHHVRNYSEIKNCELVAIADPGEAAAALAAQFGVKHYDDYQEMLKQEQPTAVTVAVPTAFHFEIVSATLKKGIHTLVEKPIASTVAEAEELMRLAAENKVVFTVGHIERYNPVIRKIQEILAEQKLGQISSIICKRLGGFPAREPKTDVVIDLAIHDIDIMNFLTGHPPRLLAAHGSRTFHSSEADSAEILLAYNGTSGFAQANWITPAKVRTISVTGSKGYLEANYITQEVALYETQIQQQDSFEEFVAKLGNPKETMHKGVAEEPLKIELEAFLKAVVGQDTTSLMNPKEATIALEIALKSSLKIAERTKDEPSQ